MALSLKEALARRGEPKAESNVRSGIPTRLRLRMIGDIDRPVDVARLLVAQGVTLKRAHAFLQRIAAGEPVAAQIRSRDLRALVNDFATLGIEAIELKVPDVNPRDIRARLNLSQADFAAMFGLELDTIQNWDQGRNQPDAATRILLAIIDRDPSVVEAILMAHPGIADPTPVIALTNHPLRAYPPA